MHILYTKNKNHTSTHKHTRVHENSTLLGGKRGPFQKKIYMNKIHQTKIFFDNGGQSMNKKARSTHQQRMVKDHKSRNKEMKYTTEQEIYAITSYSSTCNMNAEKGLKIIT